MYIDGEFWIIVMAFLMSVNSIMDIVIGYVILKYFLKRSLKNFINDICADIDEN